MYLQIQQLQPKRLDKVLQTKIKNPDTGNTILVKSALKYDDTMRVKKQAVTLVKQAMKGQCVYFSGIILIYIL